MFFPKIHRKNTVLQVFSWVEAWLSRTQRRGTRPRPRKRLNRFNSITFSGKLEPQYLARWIAVAANGLVLEARDPLQPMGMFGDSSVRGKISAMAKPKRPVKVPDKSNSQRAVEMLLLFAPAPIRRIAATPLGSRIILTIGAGLLATGALSVDWENGIPKVTFHKDKIGDATQQVKDELNKQGIQWTTNPQGVVFSGEGQQIPVPVQSLPGFQASYQTDPAYSQPYYPPQNLPPQTLPPGYYPPGYYPTENPPPQNLPPTNWPPQSPGQALPPGYGYGQAQGPSYPPGYYR